MSALEVFGKKLFLGVDVSEDLKLIADEANNNEFDNKSQTDNAINKSFDMHDPDRVSALSQEDARSEAEKSSKMSVHSAALSI